MFRESFLIIKKDLESFLRAFDVLVSFEHKFPAKWLKIFGYNFHQPTPDPLAALKVCANIQNNSFSFAESFCRKSESQTDLHSNLFVSNYNLESHWRWFEMNILKLNGMF